MLRRVCTTIRQPSLTPLQHAMSPALVRSAGLVLLAHMACSVQVAVAQDVSWKSVCTSENDVTTGSDGRRHAAIDCKYKGGDIRLTSMPAFSTFIMSKAATLGVENHMITQLNYGEFSSCFQLFLVPFLKSV